MSAIHRHIRGDRLEAYLLNKLPAQQAGNPDDPKLEALEIHLLTCSRCQQRAELLDHSLGVIRQALVTLARESAPKGKVRSAGA